MLALQGWGAAVVLCIAVIEPVWIMLLVIVGYLTRCFARVADSVTGESEVPEYKVDAAAGAAST